MFNFHHLGSWHHRVLWVVAFLFFLPIDDSRYGAAHAAYEHAVLLFQHGEFVNSQVESILGYKQFQISDPVSADKFMMLDVQDLVWRGMNNDAMEILNNKQYNHFDPDETIKRIAFESVILTRQQKFEEADKLLITAKSICDIANYEACGDALRIRGTLRCRQGRFADARQDYLDTLAFAHEHHDRFLEASSSLNLGFVAIISDRYDEAIDWSKSAYQLSNDLNAEDLKQAALGNLGSVYYRIGDGERALDLFRNAKERATKIGDIRDELIWISNTGYVYQDAGDLAQAKQSYRQALYLARQIDSKEDIANLLEDLAVVSVNIKDYSEADSYINQVIPMVQTGSRRLRANVILTKGMLSAARGQNQQAEVLFNSIEKDTQNPTSVRLSAGNELAKLYERENHIKDAYKIYQATLVVFESARFDVKREESRLPFAALAAPIYDDYIQFLIRQGRTDDALRVADQGRAQTLVEGLGLTAARATFKPESLNPNQVARKAGATLLFYWLGKKQSYLWAITPAKTTLFPLPPRAEIAALVKRYGKTLENLENPLENGNTDGEALYRMLLAPAAKLIAPNAPAILLTDGELSQINFETLVAPGRGAGPNAPADHHYWIEDATVTSASSISMLAKARPTKKTQGKLLLMGDAVAPSDDYPDLPMASMEMKLIQKHFTPRTETVLAREKANPAAYLASDPGQYAYIHFVTHGTASQVDPLDSAIILSRATKEQESFKLYARDIVQHPLQAQLVTISACYGSGSRAYAGEGLVGLSWAFLRAGAHNVVGALWDVSDDSTPRLMDSLYQEMNQGQIPANALRRAKMAMLHSTGRFRAPFYWAPFQLYSGE